MTCTSVKAQQTLGQQLFGGRIPCRERGSCPQILPAAGSAASTVAMLAASIPREASNMDSINAARTGLEQAIGLPAVLDAAYHAFDQMLGAIKDQQDPSGGAFAAFVMSGAAAANGRDALAAAPSLPRAASGDLAETTAGSFHGLTPEDAAAVLAGLSQLLASRLNGACEPSADAADRIACAQAARHAASICSLLGGLPDP
jgi:hypothetical protein